MTLVPEEGNSPETLCDQAILELAYGSGLTLSELCDLRIDQVQLSSGYVTVIGKGQRERSIPMGKRAIEALSRYVEIGRPKLVAKFQKELFLTRRGTCFAHNTMWLRVKKRAERLSRNFTPNMLRNSFAAHLLERGAGAQAVQVFMGHASAASTEAYAQVTRPKLFSTFAQFHPRAQAWTQPNAKSPPAPIPSNHLVLEHRATHEFGITVIGVPIGKLALMSGQEVRFVRSEGANAEISVTDVAGHFIGNVPRMNATGLLHDLDSGMYAVGFVLDLYPREAALQIQVIVGNTSHDVDRYMCQTKRKTVGPVARSPGI